MNRPAPSLRPATLITGASSGIGAALARVFAANGHELMLVARRRPLLDQIADGIAATGAPRPHVLPLDLNGAGAAVRVAAELAALGLEPQYVVNNAGFGLLGDVTQLDRDEQLAMIDLDVRVLAELSLAFVDSLSRRRGGILNVGSVAGFLPGPGMATYYACKAFVLSFSEALHQELSARGIRVTVLCPGPVRTEFQARAGIKTLAGSQFLACSAERVAAAGYSGLMRGQMLVVPGPFNKLVTMLPRILPRRFFLRAVAHSHSGWAKPSGQS
jgi:short-subunit dehydrogenase